MFPLWSRMGGSSIFFTSMATGMILSVSWGTKELPGGEAVQGEEETVRETEAADGPAPAKEHMNKRTEFEINA